MVNEGISGSLRCIVYGAVVGAAVRHKDRRRPRQGNKGHGRGSAVTARKRARHEPLSENRRSEDHRLSERHTGGEDVTAALPSDTEVEM